MGRVSGVGFRKEVRTVSRRRFAGGSRKQPASMGGLIRRAIRGFVEKGYIRAAISGGECRWHWTHNNRIDRLYAEPESGITSCRENGRDRYACR